MIRVFKSAERGFEDHGWLKSLHTFSFGDYYDPMRTGFSVLRVINEDQIEGGAGFGFDPHPHRNMEILSYVIEGELEHKDSMGKETLLKPGEIQRMSAGTGIRHSEYNHLSGKNARFLQIWILPEKTGVEPSYDQKSFEKDFGHNDLVLVVSKTGKNGSLSINQNVNIYACKSNSAGEKNFKTDHAHQHLWLQIIKGQIRADDAVLEPGDGAEFENVQSMDIKWNKDSEFLLFELP